MNRFWNKKNDRKQRDTGGEIEQQHVLSDEEKHSYRYFLEYKFIPDLVAGVSKGKISPESILHTEGWEDFLKKCVDANFFFEWDDLRCDGIKINDTYVMALYFFPKPQQVPDAAYGAVLINTTTNHTVYYTLEYSFDGEWVLGSTNQTKHLNYGKFENPDLKNFIDWVVKRAKETAPVSKTAFSKEDE